LGAALAAALMPFAAHAQAPAAAPMAAPAATAPSWNWGGDVRVREDLRVRTHRSYQEELTKLRMLVGATGSLADGKVDWGFRFGTFNNAVSRNIVLAGGDLNGNNAMGIDLAYLKFKPTDRLSVAVGKIVNPFWESYGVFDPDLTPEGAALSYRIYQAKAKGDLFSNVDNTVAYFGVRNAIAGVNNQPWMLGDQIRATTGRVDLGLACYFYSGLNEGGKVAAMTQSSDQTVAGLFTKDQMTVISGKVRHAFKVVKQPLVVSGEIWDNVQVSKHCMGFEGKVEAPKFLGTGRGSLTYRESNQDSTLAAWADDDLGEGTGYKAGIQAQYSVPIYKNVDFEADYFHYDRWQPLSNPGAMSTNRVFLQVEAKF
jgi:hypothetical protein